MAVEKRKKDQQPEDLNHPPSCRQSQKIYLSNSTFRSCVLRVMSPARFHCAMLLVGELFWFFVIEGGLGISIGFALTGLFFFRFFFKRYCQSCLHHGYQKGRLGGSRILSASRPA